MGPSLTPATTKTQAISGWFGITLAASALCLLAAAMIGGENVSDRFGNYFVISMLAISSLRIICFVADWIAAGFSGERLNRLVAQAKLIALVGGAAALTYLALPLLRYGVISAIGCDRSGTSSSFVIIDRFSGELYRVERISGRPQPRHPTL